jgi:hypothetical protein
MITLKFKKAAPWLALLLAAGVPLALYASAPGAGTVTFASGKNYTGNNSAGPWAETKVGDSISDGIFVKTDAGSKLELTLSDGSVLRLGENTLFQLESAKAKKDKGMSFSVLLGQAWAKVKTVSGGQKFEVKTKTAVAGVRGTVFSVLAMQDAATTVKVFEGEVAINNKPSVDKTLDAEKMAKAPAKPGERVKVSGPKQITKKAWEEMIAKAMQMVTVASNGDISAALAFDLEVEKKDDWVAWNIDRDSKIGRQQ